MSCHISALCITLPCPKRGLVETTLGREISWRVEKTPISPPSKHQQHLSLPLHFVVAGGHLLRRALSTSLPQLLTKKEFSTYPSSGLCWRETHNTQKENPAVWCQVGVATQSQCSPWRMGSQTRRRCFVASPVCSTVRAESLCTRSSQKGCPPKSLILSWSYFQLEFWSQEA